MVRTSLSALAEANKYFESLKKFRPTALLGNDANHGAFDTPFALDPTRRLPIFSFLVRWRTRFLHYNFVGALLNDLFGVQTRGGAHGSYVDRQSARIIVYGGAAQADGAGAFRP